MWGGAASLSGGRRLFDTAPDKNENAIVRFVVYVRRLWYDTYLPTTSQRALSDSFWTVQASYEAKKGTFEITLDADSKDNDGGREVGSQAVVCTATVEFKNELDDVAKITVECEDEKLAVNVRECLQNIAIGKYCFCWCWPGHQLRKTDLSFVFSVN